MKGDENAAPTLARRRWRRRAESTWRRTVQPRLGLRFGNGSTAQQSETETADDRLETSPHARPSGLGQGDVDTSRGTDADDCMCRTLRGSTQHILGYEALMTATSMPTRHRQSRRSGDGRGRARRVESESVTETPETTSRGRPSPDSSVARRPESGRCVCPGDDGLARAGVSKDLAVRRALDYSELDRDGVRWLADTSQGVHVETRRTRMLQLELTVRGIHCPSSVSIEKRRLLRGWLEFRPQA